MIGEILIGVGAIAETTAIIIEAVNDYKEKNKEDNNNEEKN